MKYTGKVTEVNTEGYYVCLEGYTWCQRFKNTENVKVGDFVEIDTKIVNPNAAFLKENGATLRREGIDNLWHLRSYNFNYWFDSKLDHKSALKQAALYIKLQKTGLFNYGEVFHILENYRC